MCNFLNNLSIIAMNISVIEICSQQLLYVLEHLTYSGSSTMVNSLAVQN